MVMFQSLVRIPLVNFSYLLFCIKLLETYLVNLSQVMSHTYMFKQYLMTLAKINVLIGRHFVYITASLNDSDCLRLNSILLDNYLGLNTTSVSV